MQARKKIQVSEGTRAQPPQLISTNGQKCCAQALCLGALARAPCAPALHRTAGPALQPMVLGKCTLFAACSSLQATRKPAGTPTVQRVEPQLKWGGGWRTHLSRATPPMVVGALSAAHSPYPDPNPCPLPLLTPYLTLLQPLPTHLQRAVLLLEGLGLVGVIGVLSIWRLLRCQQLLLPLLVICAWGRKCG